MKRERAFTLIELLIVVAIIAILAAIAVPNFLEAQTRAKVSRVKADIRSLATAIEAYAVDHNRYPYGMGNEYHSVYGIIELSTPVAYISSVQMEDPFNTEYVVEPDPENGGYVTKPTYGYMEYNADGHWPRGYNQDVSEAEKIDFDGCLVYSYGPDREDTGLTYFPVWNYYYANDTYSWMTKEYRDGSTMRLVYDPTNGTTSKGDVGRFIGCTWAGNHPN